MNDQVISLFSGAGGFSLGFSWAGAKPFIGAELDDDARRTYEKNLSVPCHQVDLGTVCPKTLRVALGVRKKPLAIIGGPPCQGFSSAGAKSLSDPRNKLIFNYLRIVEEFQPRWFLFENVEGLLTANSGRSLHELAIEFIRLGYWIRIEKVNFASFGLPQSRKRVIIAGNRVGLDFGFPKPTHSFRSGKHNAVSSLPESPALESALSGLGDVVKDSSARSEYSASRPTTEYDAFMRSGNEANSVLHHFMPRTSSSDAQRIGHLLPGQTMKDLPEDLWHESYRRRAFRRVADGTPTDRRGGAPSGLKRLHGDLNSLTITSAASREFIHPKQDRPLSLRECARLQSFPDRFEFEGNVASVAKQIGNAVPPMAGEVFGRLILDSDGRIGSGKSRLRNVGAPCLMGFQLTDAGGMSPALAQTYAHLATLLPDLFTMDEGRGSATR